jgi:prevent-host-death family protein
MRVVDIREVKDQLSRLLDEVEAGEEIVIARNGRPTARLTPLPDGRPQRVLGQLAGQHAVPSEWDAPAPPDAIIGFEGRS